VKQLTEKLFVVEDFIFSDTCDFLIDEFSKDLKSVGSPGIFRGPVGDTNKSINNKTINKNANTISGMNKILNKSKNSHENIAIDLFTSICTNIEKTLSQIFKKDLALKSYFYSHMKTGGVNSLHVDNYFEDQSDDFSAILYLSDSYEGGEINFPQIGIELKPKPGTLLAFVGNKELEHEVKYVDSGDRVNIILFLNERRKHENQDY
jgi:hypothetical protein